MGTKSDSAGTNSQSPRTDASSWIILVIGTSIGLAITAAFCHVIGLPTWFSIWACSMVATFVAMPILTGKVGEAHRLTQRRATALFGIIPAVGVGAGILISSLGLGLPASLYSFSAVIVVCTFIYWTWFDEPVSSSRGGDPGQQGPPDGAG